MVANGSIADASVVTTGTGSIYLLGVNTTAQVSSTGTGDISVNATSGSVDILGAVSGTGSINYNQVSSSASWHSDLDDLRALRLHGETACALLRGAMQAGAGAGVKCRTCAPAVVDAAGSEYSLRAHLLHAIESCSSQSRFQQVRWARSWEPVFYCQGCGMQPGRLAGSELKVKILVVCCCAGLPELFRGSELQTQGADSLSAAAAGSPACQTFVANPADRSGILLMQLRFGRQEHTSSSRVSVRCCDGLAFGMGSHSNSTVADCLCAIAGVWHLTRLSRRRAQSLDTFLPTGCRHACSAKQKPCHKGPQPSAQ